MSPVSQHVSISLSSAKTKHDDMEVISIMVWKAASILCFTSMKEKGKKSEKLRKHVSENEKKKEKSYSNVLNINDKLMKNRQTI